MSSNLSVTVASVTAGAAKLLSSNNDSASALIQPAGIIFVGGSGVTTTTGYRLLANTDFSLGRAGDLSSRSIYTGDLYAIATTTTTVYVMTLS